MSLAPYIPLSFRGTLHDVRLINFSIDLEEAQALLPPQLWARNFRDRALVSMVSVQLRNMRLRFLPALCGFRYQHTAFRLLIDDSRYTGSQPKGIYFARSFVNNPFLAFGGELLTDFRFNVAQMEQTQKHLLVESNEGSVSVGFSDAVADTDPELRATIGAIDRAYAVHSSKVYKVQIQRNAWPLEPLACTYFQTSFFHSARFEGAFIVPETIPYVWLPPQEILP